MIPEYYNFLYTCMFDVEQCWAKFQGLGTAGSPARNLFPAEGRGRSRRSPPWGLAQPYSNTARDAPPVAVSRVGLLRTLPGMFIGHSQIAAFVLHRNHADKPAPLYGAGYSHFITTSCFQRRLLLGTPRSRDLFLEVMEEIRQRHQFVVVGYVVMPEHVHFLFNRAGARKSVTGAGRFETRLRPSAAARTSRHSPCPGERALEYTRCRGTHLATPLLRFRCVYREEARGKAALHASQSKSMEAMGKYKEELGKAGVLLALDGLTPPATMSARVTFKNGKSKVTDGPFTEAKEVVGGYWIIQVKSREEALEWAARIPGKDNEMVEVRRMFDMTDFDPETQKEIQKKFGDDVAAEMRQ
jgi:hypothetical protein